MSYTDPDLYLDKCPYCDATGPFSVDCTAWMLFKDGEPVGQIPEEVEMAAPIVGTDVYCHSCGGEWIVGEDPSPEAVAARDRAKEPAAAHETRAEYLRRRFGLDGAADPHPT